jgi:hypothetical protein
MKINQKQSRAPRKEIKKGNSNKIIRFIQKPIVFFSAIIVIVIASMLAGVYLYKAGIFSKIKAHVIDTSNDIHSEVQLELSPYMDNGLETLYLDISFDDFQQISEKRDEAMSAGILITSDEDYVPGEIHLENQNPQKVELRLKGDWTDHLAGDKWSFRIHMKGDGQIFGLRNFSIQAPETREYLNEWAYHQFLLQNGLMTTHYYFVNIMINGEPKGIYAIEESFAEELIESEEARQGVLLRFNEDNMWQNTYNFWNNGINIGGGLWVTNLSTAEVNLFREGTVMRDEVLSKEGQAAIALLEGYQQGTLQASEVFDTDLMGKFYAASDLWAAGHGTAWHNIRFYYNPVTGLLEPIVYDGEALGSKENPNTLATVFAEEQLFLHPDIRSAYAKYALVFSDLEKIDAFIENNSDEFYKYQSAIEKEYFQLANSETLESPWGVIRERAQMLQLQFDVDKPLDGFVTPLWMSNSDRDGSFLELNIQNQYLIPINLVSLTIDDQIYLLNPEWIDQSTINAFNTDQTSDVQLLNLNQWGEKAPLNGRLYIPYDLQSIDPLNTTITLNIKIAGTEIAKSVSLPLQEGTVDVLSEFRPDIPALAEALSLHSYLNLLDEENKQMEIAPGEWIIRNDLILPQDYSLVIHEGTTLKFANNAILYTTGSLFFDGTVDYPVVLEALNECWPGIVVIRAQEKSVLQHTIIRDTASIQRGGWILTGGITFYESPVKLNHVSIDGTFAEDSINVIRTTFEFTDSSFVNTASDAFDSDFSDGTFVGCMFENVGGDAVDISGSVTEVYDTSFTNITDKAVSVGEHSSVLVQDVEINGTGLGIASKDLSDATLLRVSINGAKNAALAAYQKKPVFGPASIIGEEVSIFECERISIIQAGSEARINGNFLETIDQTFDELFNQGLLGS